MELRDLNLHVQVIDNLISEETKIDTFDPKERNIQSPKVNLIESTHVLEVIEQNYQTQRQEMTRSLREPDPEEADLFFPRCLLKQLDPSLFRSLLVDKIGSLQEKLLVRKEEEDKKQLEKKIEKQKEEEQKLKQREQRREQLNKKIEEKNNQKRLRHKKNSMH